MKTNSERRPPQHAPTAALLRDLTVDAATAQAVKAGILGQFAKMGDIRGECEYAGSDRGWIEVMSYSLG